MADQGTLDAALVAVRVAVGCTLALHGYQKLIHGGRLAGTARWFESLGMHPGRLHAAASADLASGLGFALGFLTPLTAAGSSAS